ncbi:MAG: hypothetical protein JWM34_1633 [Ilumatobacteraceae bacterium]|nr:hypothetical protein [Ilumatobacteraceae bacterium]
MSRHDGTGVRDDAGFSLIELLIAIVLSSIIVGVITAALATSLNVARSTTDQVNDSTDAGVISSFLFRDAQSTGTTNPATALTDITSGVSIVNTVAGWAGCAQTGALVARFAWIDPASVSRRTSIVVTYALDTQQQLTRRTCINGTTTDVIVGRHVSSAVATCLPDPACITGVRTVTLAVAGTGLRAPFSYRLTAAVTNAVQTPPDPTNSTRIALVALGTPAAPTTCPTLTLTGSGAITVIGDTLIDGSCGTTPIGGTTTLLRPTGVTSTIVGATDPLATLPAPAYVCAPTGTNPATIGASPAASSVTVYPQLISLTSDTTFAPGTYVFCNGLNVASGRLTGTGVTMYIVAGPTSLAAAATIDLTAPQTGAYANLLIWDASPQGLDIAGGTPVTNLRGLTYAPTSTTRLTSSVGLNIGGIVTRDVTVTGAGQIRIGLPLPAITLAAATVPAAEVGVGYSVAVTTTGGTAPSTWQVAGTPPGLTIDPTAGTISGNPTTAGTFTTTVTSFDATAEAASIQFPITVAARLALIAPTPVNGQVAVAYAASTGTTSGGTAPIVRTASGLPPGVVIDPTTGSLSGTPTTAGTYTIVATVADALGATATTTISVTVRARLATAAPTLIKGLVGAAYTASIAATGGSTPYLWNATGLPAGITISTAGAISGSPTTAGSYPITFNVTDAVGATAQTTATLVVDPLPVVVVPVPAGCPATSNGWQGEYFANATLTAPSTLCRDDAAVNFDWADGSPATGLPVDNFSVRWTRTQAFTAGVYTFNIGSDDGSRLYIDNVLVFDRWVDQGYPSPVPTVTRSLAAGPHTVVLEYYERGGSARASLTWTVGGPASCSIAATGWLGEYFSNISLSDLPTVCRDDPSVNFNWAFGIPITGVPADTFSVRWTRVQSFVAGTYTFKLGTDDGGRLYVDGTLVIDRWADQGYPAPLPSATVQLAAGPHTVIVEYYERSGLAIATLSWS